MAELNIPVNDFCGLLINKLYDLTTDPGESTDLAKEHPEVVKQLAACSTRPASPGALGNETLAEYPFGLLSFAKPGKQHGLPVPFIDGDLAIASLAGSRSWWNETKR